MLKVYPVLCRAGYMDNYAYIIKDIESEEVAIVDPSEAKPIISECEKLKLTPKFILNTHHHFDHTDGNLKLAEKYQAKIVCNKSDMHRINGAEIGINPESTFNLGNSTAEIIDASAHTQGHILFYFENDKILFTGDTLFNLCIGGLFEGTPKQMFEVLKKIKQLPNEVVFYPGHEYTQGGAAFAFRYNQGNKLIRDYLEYAKTRLDLGLPVSPISLEKEKQCNPYLQVNTFEEFENL